MIVGLLYGGPFSEGVVSTWSAAGVRESLKSLDHTVVDLEFDFNIAQRLANTRVDVVFNAMHGTMGEDGRIPAMLDIMRIPYTHSGHLASAIAMNKAISKSIFRKLGLTVAKDVSVKKSDLISGKYKEIATNAGLKGDLFCKPISDGSSRDTFIIKSPYNQEITAEMFMTIHEDFMLEERILGREFDVAIIDGKPIGAVEILPKGEFYDFSSKYDEGGSQHLDPNLPQSVLNEMLDISLRIHNTIGLRGISRPEFIITEDNKIYVLEINSHPGFTKTSIVPDIGARHGISYNDIVEILLKNAKYDS